MRGVLGVFSFVFIFTSIGAFASQDNYDIPQGGASNRALLAPGVDKENNNEIQFRAPKENMSAHEMHHFSQQGALNPLGVSRSEVHEAEDKLKSQLKHVSNLKKYGLANNSREVLLAKKKANLQWQVLQAYKGKEVREDEYPFPEVK